MTEKQQAFDLANAVLDKPYIDPDGDISMLARQFLRAREEIDAMREAMEPFAKIADSIPDGLADKWILEGAWSEGVFAKVTNADFRRARAVLANFTVPVVSGVLTESDEEEAR